MIIYQASKNQFIADVLQNEIEKKILISFVRETGRSTGKSEIDSWRNSMMYMNNIINDPEIPEDVGIAIEYKIPSTSNRIDFILTGRDAAKNELAVLIELKQWSQANMTDKDGVVETFIGGGSRETAHPSYQVWSYAALLADFNQTVEEDNIQLKPCAYLHNYEPDDNITNEFYKEYLDKAPVFLRPDALKLKQFVKQFVKYGDDGDILYRIDNGKIRPTKNLADNLASMLEGNQEFLMIDDQKVVYESALNLGKIASSNKKQVLIVQGGPGTGKSVVAINLLVEMTKRRLLAQYITKNSAPREVYHAKLTGRLTRSRISSMFTSSGTFHAVESNTFDALIVDEAHRLNEKSGLYQNIGVNQVKELINASKLTVFFIDEDQRIDFKDIGTKDEIYHWAQRLGAEVKEQELVSQFRCNGSDGYLAWLDNALQVRQTANESLDDIGYDFRVLDDPVELQRIIVEKNHIANKARIVAGYCWDWISTKEPLRDDIVIGNFSAQWNLKDDGQSWIIKPNSVSEVGCIHTCQGLELDYVAVIIGPDFVIRNGRAVTDASKRAGRDKTVYGYKRMLQEDPEFARAKADMVIKNTYRTLMSRGQKGCYIFCTDPETQKYFKDRLESIKADNLNAMAGSGASIVE